MGTDYEDIKYLFPPETKIIHFSGSPDKFEANLRSKCKSKEEFCQKWLKPYENLSKLTFRVLLTKPKIGKTVVYKAAYRCHHNTYPGSHRRVKAAHKKHTACPAVLKVTIKSSIENRRVRSSDTLRREYPTIVTVIHDHNHTIEGADALKYRDMSEEVKTKLIDLFKNNYSPARALQIHKENLMKEHEDEYYKVTADSSQCPNIQAVYRLYYSVSKTEQLGNKKFLQGYLEDIKQRVQPTTKMLYHLIDDEDFVLAAVPAFMERVHTLECSGKTVFIDSSGGMDRYNCKAFLLLSDSSVGRLPLGFFLTTSETEEAISCGLQLLKDILRIAPFGGNVNKGPDIFLTDNCVAQIRSLRKIFPHSVILLCAFRLLQSVWRWLFDSLHKINNDDRQYLFMLFKKTVYSADKAEFQRHSENLLIDTVANLYPDYIKYINNLFEKSHMWSHTFGEEIRDSGVNVENAMKVMKDSISYWTRSYNPVQLFQFLETDFCNNFSCRIGEFINGKFRGYEHMRYFPYRKKLTDFKVEQNEENGLYKVKNESTKAEHIVDLELSFCSCHVGKTGNLCQHQQIVSHRFKKPCQNIVPFDANSRDLYHWIAYGTTVSNDFCSNLTSPEKQSHDDYILGLPVFTYDDDDVIMEVVIEDDHKEEETTSEEEELDWASVQQRWNSLFEKWKLNNSIPQYKALLEATAYLENCKTETATISALHRLGKKLKVRKYGTQIPVLPTSVARSNVQCVGQSSVQRAAC